jgi:hypothetical protein
MKPKLRGLKVEPDEAFQNLRTLGPLVLAVSKKEIDRKTIKPRRNRSLAGPHSS